MKYQFAKGNPFLFPILYVTLFLAWTTYAYLATGTPLTIADIIGYAP